MKRLEMLIICMVLGLGLCKAQNLSELFEGNDFLTSLFVSPLGIQDLPDLADAASLENEISASGNEYKVMNLGPLGEVFSISPIKMAIGETPIKTMNVWINADSLMLIYLSESSSAYTSMYSTLENSLSQYAKNIERSNYGNFNYAIYMLSEDYGVAIGANEERQTSIACLLDVKNLHGFLNLDSFITK